MNDTTKEILLSFSSTLMHYGMPRRSGRYPWGSGKEPYQTASDWLGRVEQLAKEGKTNREIAEEFKLGTVEFNSYRSIAIRERRLDEGIAIQKMVDSGMNYSEIGRKMNIPDTSVRAKLMWYKKQQEPNSDSVQRTVDYLKNGIDKLGGPLDIGEGVSRKLGVSQEKLEQAISIMENSGYSVTGGNMDRVTDPTSNNKFTLRIIGKGELPKNYIRENFDQIHSINELDTRLVENGAAERPSFVYPESMDISRLKINYAETGGKEKDGVIEIRRGVKDLSLGDSHYAQVRILVDNDRYLKGMAVYSDDLPPGVDVLFNTNKSQSVPARDVLKKIKTDDPVNPFGSLIKENGGQSYYDDPNGKYTDPITGKKQSLSLINKRQEEGEWKEWSDRIPAQFLSKQPLKLINRQLDLTIAEKKAEYEEILSCTNPTVKKDLLLKFADECDTTAVNLKAVALPGQKYSVILPLTSIGDREVYAPNYQEGSQVALVRYPHGGTFEIPILTVNNKSQEGRNVIGTNSPDAIGISSKVAERLSGADFDGDTVQVIPISDKVSIRSTNPLKGLEGFDPKEQYPKREGMRFMRYETTDPKTGRVKVIDHTQKEMGKISNLISDMTILGATPDELAAAVRHSMVVIDAGKHELDYIRSEKENGIRALKKKYQGVINEETGRLNTPAATIISRAKNEASAPKTYGQGHINPETGDMEYKIDTRPGKNGKPRTQKSTQMAEASDAFDLVSQKRMPTELAYAEFANQMKDYAREARKEYLRTNEIARDPEVAKEYAPEVESLKRKLAESQANQDVERWAHIRANAEVHAAIERDPSLQDDKKAQKKVRQQALVRAREFTGAKRRPIHFTDREWECVQKGGIGKTVLAAILKYADPDEVKQRAMPRTQTGLSAAKISWIKSLAASGYTNEQIASRLNISATSVSDYLRGKRGAVDG